MTNSASFGFDLGHSSVKLSVKKGGAAPLTGGNDIFQTVVRNWFSIGNEETAKKAEADTVEVNGKKFFIGRTALLQGQAEGFTGQNRNWIETEQHDALLVGAWNRANNILANNNVANPDQISLVLGLPASYYKEQRSLLRARAQALIAPRLQNHQKLNVFIESQSRAPLVCVAFTGEGIETGNAGEDQSWGVVEIGHFTTDFTFFDRGQEIDGSASSAEGVHKVYDELTAAFKQKGHLSDSETITTAIKTRKIKVYGQEVDVSELVSPAISDFSNYILEEISKRFGEKTRRMDGVVVAGGGAYIVGPQIKALYSNAVIPKNPRFAVAEGYARFGLLTLQ